MIPSVCKTEVNEDGLELVEHGNEAFPVAFYEDDFSMHPLPWHWHDELEVFLVVQGSVRFRTVSGEYILNEGEGLFINSGKLHAAWSNGMEMSRFHSIVFHPRFVGGESNSVFWKKYLEPMLKNDSMRTVHLKETGGVHKEILEHIEDAWQLSKKETRGYEFLVREHLSKIVYLLDSNYETSIHNLSDKQLRDAKRIKKMLGYIDEHLEDEITIENIAQSAMISVSECLRCFKTTIGVTPIQYVRQARIQKAVDLLLNTQLTITDIAMRCGFQEMSYFSKIFRQTHGVTPREFRQGK